MQNPLGTKADTPLEVAVHKGGYGDAFIVAAERAYQERFPSATLTHTGLKSIDEALLPRFARGNPPDLVSSAGANQLDQGALIRDGKLLALTELLAAPSLDDPTRTVEETLLPGTVDIGVYDGTCYALNYAYNVYGLFHSSALFARHGWEFPRTWDAMLGLCAEIKKAGIAPWTYGGSYLLPLLRSLLMMAMKEGGARVLSDIDNLAPGAWRTEPVLAAAEAMHELVRKGYILPGTDKLTYLEAQAEFVHGRAAFIPCGSWLDNEMRGVTPDGFDMVITPTPTLGATADATVPQEAVMAVAAEPFLVPADAANSRGGLELLRIMVSRSQARRFTELTGALTCVDGAADGVPLTPALASARAALDAAGKHTYFLMFHLWYREFDTALGHATARLMSGEWTPDEWSRQCQRLADGLAADADVPKYTR